MSGQLPLDQDPSPAAPTGPLVRVRAAVAYDGAPFRGFAEQAGVTTVAGCLADALEQVLGRRPELSAAGRTDAGVHARGQVISFDAPEGTDVERLAVSLTSMLRPSIAVTDAEVADDGFDARRSATRRRYRYRVLNRRGPDPLRHSQVWHVAEPLDVPAMRLACDPLHGEQDFSCMCRAPKRAEGDAPASLHRRVFAASWETAPDDELVFTIEANAFCHQMVRSIVGAHVAVGRGDLRAGDLRDLMRAGDRRPMPSLAPPEGLCLWSVSYDGERVHP